MREKARASRSDHLDQLVCGTLTFIRCGLPHLRAGQLGVRESYAVIALTQQVARRRLTVPAEEKTRRCDGVGMAPAIGRDAGDVA